MNCVSQRGAMTYCAWVSGRLPLMEEWRAEAKNGDEKRPFAWGREAPSCRRLIFSSGSFGCGRKASWPVGSAPDGASVSGLLDMNGNMWEFVIENRGDPEPEVLLGGSWENVAVHVDNDDVYPWDRDGARAGIVGFRCVRETPP